MHGGKIYETDGENQIAVHEWHDTNLLAPIGQPPSIRLFFSGRPAFAELLSDSDIKRNEPSPSFMYLNPNALFGPYATVPRFGLSSRLGLKCCVGAVICEECRSVAVDDADKCILGYCLVGVLFAEDLQRDELAAGFGLSRSHEAGIIGGPALTTPDELEQAAFDTELGKRYGLTVTVRVNGEVIGQESLSEFPWSFADLVSYASESCTLLTGEVMAVEIGRTPSSQGLGPGDEIVLASEHLGSLAFRLE